MMQLLSTGKSDIFAGLQEASPVDVKFIHLCCSVGLGAELGMVSKAHE